MLFSSPAAPSAFGIRFRGPACLGVLWLLATAVGAGAGDWPQWRGPERNGISREAGLRTTWPEGGPPAAWKATGVGTGYASVVVAGSRVYTLGRRGQDVFVSALDAQTGRPVWATRLSSTSRIPASTPTVDGDRVYALDPDGGLVCLRAASGAILWRKHLVRDFGGQLQSGRGYNESPLVDGERLICTPGGPEALLVALHKQTGAVLWKCRPPALGPAGRDGAGFSSVVITEAAGRRQVVQLVGRGLVGVDAADGKFLWGYNAIANGTANIPTPVVRGDLIFSANGYNAGSVMLRLTPGGETGVTAQVVYTLSGSRFQNHHGGVVLVGDHLYGGHGSNNGLPTCLEFQTGRIVWKERGVGVGSAAVVCAGGLLYFRYQNGVVALLQASPEGLTVRGTLQVPGAGGDSWAHPVVAQGKLFLREQDTVWVYDLRLDSGKDAPGRALGAAGRSGRTGTLGAASRALPSRTRAEAAGVRVARRRGLLASFAPPVSPRAARLYRFLGPATRERVLRVAVPGTRLTKNGTLSRSVVDALKGVGLPVVVELSGTGVSDAGLAQIAGLPGVRGLVLEFCAGITDAGLQQVARLTELRLLGLAGTPVSEKGLAALSPLKHLAALDLEVCENVGDAAGEPLGQLSGLRALVLKKTGFEPQRLTDAGLAPLSRLTALELLDLYGNKITDTGLAALAPLTALRTLDLSLTPTSDAGLVHLRGLTRLEQVDLLYSEGFAGPRITDAGLETLLVWKDLRSLNLTGAKLTDAAGVRLSALGKLTTLRLVRTGLTDDGLRALRQALPRCRITP